MKPKKEAERKHLIRVIEKSQAFDAVSKRNLLLFVSGAKPNTYVRLRIEKNMHDKHEFERLLKLNKIVFSCGKVKGFEEIVRFKKNAAVWKFVGTWYGYDLFRTKEDKKKFEKYVSLIKQGKHTEGDLIAGALYGYPECCVQEHIKWKNLNYLKKHYTYYEYFKRLHDIDKKLPYVSFTPGSLHCPKVIKLNKNYAKALKEISPSFYKQYNKKRTYQAKIVVDLESDGEWQENDGHEYSVITLSKIEGVYLLISHLSKKYYERGAVLDSTITLQHHHATVTVKKQIGKIENLHHERKFTMP